MHYYFNIILILLEITIIYIYSTNDPFNLSKIITKSNINISLINFTIIWFAKGIIFYFLLFLNIFNSQNIRFVTFILINGTLFALVLKYRLKFEKLRFKYFNLITMLVGVFMANAFSKPNAWDDFSYHIPVELLIRDSGSLWNWPDLIYAQWDFIQSDVLNSIYTIAYSNLITATSNSVLAATIIILLFINYFPKKYLFSIVIILTSIPAFVQQITTRYNEIITAWGVIVIFIILLEGEINSKNRKNFYTVLFPLSIFSIGIKYSSLLIFLLITLYFIQKYKLKTFYISISFIVSFLISSIPIYTRNYIEHQNIFFPYYFFDKKNGYLSYFEIGTVFNSIYIKSMESNFQNLFEAVIYQYFVYPVYIIIFHFFNFNLSLFSDSELINKFYTYDNRIGGFGISVFLLLLFFFKSSKIKKIIILIIGYASIFIIPVVIHPRYYLSLYLLIIFLVLNSIINALRNKTFYIVFSIILFMCTLISYNNLYNLIARSTSSNEYFFSESQKINNNCTNIIKLGSDIWFSVKLWGQNQCGKVIFGEYLYEKEIKLENFQSDKKIYNILNSSSKINNLNHLLKNKNFENLNIICSSPQNELNVSEKQLLEPCKIALNILNVNGIEYHQSEIWQEVETGPFLQMIYLQGKNPRDIGKS